jgi:hypothetical protein
VGGGEGGGRWEEGKVAQVMYTHVSKCKNNKILKKETIADKSV